MRESERERGVRVRQREVRGEREKEEGRKRV